MFSLAARRDRAGTPARGTCPDSRAAPFAAARPLRHRLHDHAGFAGSGPRKTRAITRPVGELARWAPLKPPAPHPPRRAGTASSPRIETQSWPEFLSVIMAPPAPSPAPAVKGLPCTPEGSLGLSWPAWPAGRTAGRAG